MIAARELRDTYMTAAAELLSAFVCGGQADVMAAASAGEAAGERPLTEPELRAVLRCALRLDLLLSLPETLARARGANPVRAESVLSSLGGHRAPTVTAHAGALVYALARAADDRRLWLGGPEAAAAELARIASRVAAAGSATDTEARRLAEHAGRLREFAADARWGFGCVGASC